MTLTQDQLFGLLHLPRVARMIFIQIVRHRKAFADPDMRRTRLEKMMPDRHPRSRINKSLRELEDLGLIQVIPNGQRGSRSRTQIILQVGVD